MFESLDARNKSIKEYCMDPLGVFCMLILGGEVYETFKLLRGSWVRDAPAGRGAVSRTGPRRTYRRVGAVERNGASRPACFACCV